MMLVALGIWLYAFMTAWIPLYTRMIKSEGWTDINIFLIIGCTTIVGGLIATLFFI